MAKHHELTATVATVHWGFFDATLEPVADVASGDTITISTVSGAPEYMPGPQFVVPAELTEIHRNLEPDLGPHIITGPVAVAGAEPGDRLDVEILDIRLDTDWGWNTHKPEIAALDDVADGWTQHLAIDRVRMTATLPWNGSGGPTTEKSFSLCSTTKPARQRRSSPFRRRPPTRFAAL